VIIHLKSYILVASIFFAIVSQAQDVKWYTFEEAIELNKKEPRKIMIDVYTDWCGWCKVMDKSTFNDSIVSKYLNEKYYPVKLNAEQKEDIVFNGVTFKFVAQGSRGYHELAAALLNNQLSYPSTVFLDENIRIIHVQKGYMKAQPFDEIIRFIGDDYYKTTTWEAWKTSYKSPYTSN
jgi:thioredoxin-related protein